MIPFVDLSRQHFSLQKEIEAAIKKVIYKNSHFILGSEGKKFEQEFAEYCGKKYGIGVNSGTDALFLTLLALDVRKYDEVIVPANTAIPTVMAIRAVGAKPVLIDVKDNYLLDESKIEKIITSKTKVIMPVHLYGQSCAMDTIMAIAQKYNLKIVEDCCQAHGALYKSNKVPISDIGCFSFYPSKNLGALGDGGMIVTDDEALFHRLILLRNYGQENRYHAKIFGINSRLDELQAALLSIKLKHLDSFNAKRRNRAYLYHHLLSDLREIVLPGFNEEQVYHLYVIRTKKRDALMLYLKEKEIVTQIHYPIPIHMQEGFSSLGYTKGDFPNSEQFSSEILSLPMFPELTEKEIETVCIEIKNFLGNRFVNADEEK